MHRSLLSAIVLAAAVFFSFSAPAYARDAEVSLSLGGSQIFLDDADDEDPFDEEWGIRLEPSFTLAPFESVPELRLGGGIAFNFYFDEVDTGFAEIDANLYLYTPEFLVSWRQRLGEQFYIEPGVGLGWAIGQLDTDFDNETGNGYSIRPFVRLGYQMERWSIGAEAGYRFGELEFDDAEGDYEELNVGVFLSARL